MRACDQERELLPPPPVRASGLDRNMGKQLWEPRLRADDEAEQSIDFKHRKWEFPVTTKVRTVDECLRVCVCVCVHACVQCPKLKK